MHTFEKFLLEFHDIEYAKLLYQWTVVEDLQDAMPYIEWGWDGFVPIGIYRGGGELDI